MNKKLAVLGSLVLVGGLTITFSDLLKPQAEYSLREKNHEKPQTVEDMFDLHKRMKGEYTKEDWLRAKHEAETMKEHSNRADINWYDHGPDNVGGRTRAICVDNQNIHHVWAGSVSGGLFESFNRANTWTKVEEFNENLGVSSMCQTPDGTLYIATGHQQESTTGSGNAYDTGHNGMGVFKRNSDGSFSLIDGTDDYNFINEVVADTLHNIVWIACDDGLMKYDQSNGSLVEVSGLTSGACTALSISPDGTVIVANMAGKTNVSTNSGTTWQDRSGSASSGLVPAGSARMEYAISHEKGSNGNYYVYASAGSAMHLLGVYRSENNGIDWTIIAPAGNGAPGTFSPFSHSTTSGQAAWDNIISVQRGNPDRIFLGGIDIHSWAFNGNWAPKTQWFYPPTSPYYAHADQHEMVWDKWGRLYIGNDGGIGYSDDGGETFVPANRGYNVTQFYAIGFSAHGDVIGGTQDNGTQANYHDNATWQSHDEVNGGDGFSANISFINRNILFSSVYNGAIARSSDRGQNSNSFTPPSPLWSCTPGGLEAGCGQFFTNFKMWENPKDVNSQDSIDFIPTANYDAGDIVEIPSKTSQQFIKYETPTSLVFDDTLEFNPSLTELDTIIETSGDEYNLEILEYILTFDAIVNATPIDVNDSIYIVPLDTTVKVTGYSTVNHYYGTNPLRPGKVVDMENDPVVYNVSWDTIRVQDYFQSWFAIGIGGTGNPRGVWMTRNALRLSSNANEWFQVADSSAIGEISSMEFSRDGDHLFIGTWNGQLWRLSGFGDVYSPTTGNTTIEWSNGHTETTLTRIGTFGAPVTGIAVGSDIDHVVVALGNFTSTANGKIQESLNATGGSPDWTNISGSGEGALPLMPYYAVVIDRENPDIIMVGGEFGTYITETGGTGSIEWEYCSGDFGLVPVYDMGQNWRTWDEGCRRPGEIYIGTHGRGIWSTDSYLSLPEAQDNLDEAKYKPEIVVYPNPVSDSGNISFELTQNEDVFVQIFNLNGQLVGEVSRNNMNEGKNIITFDAADLPRGTYIVRLSAGDMLETTKFIKH